PSFGPVHTRRTGTTGAVVTCRPRRGGGTCPHGRPVSCTVRHSEGDPRLGQPICPDCFDYAGAALSVADPAEPWRRFTLGFRRRRGGGTCPHGRPASCTVRHSEGDPRLGQPICPDCFDYAGAVLWNAHAPELWRRFTLAFRRHIARSAGLRVADLREVLTVSFAKVAEYQRRGLVHFHAVIRLDGPGGPANPPPAWATLDLLKVATDHAAGAVTVTTPAAGGVPAMTHAWGSQIDVR